MLLFQYNKPEEKRTVGPFDDAASSQTDEIKYKIFHEKTGRHGFQTKDFNLVPTEILKASETFRIDEAKWEVYGEKI